jgi:hypothetical protein
VGCLRVQRQADRQPHLARYVVYQNFIDYAGAASRGNHRRQTACMPEFSSGPSIREYAEKIWRVKGLDV